MGIPPLLPHAQGRNDNNYGAASAGTRLALVLLGFLAEIDDLRVEEFGGERAGERVDGGLLIGGEIGEALGGAGKLSLAESLGVLLQSDDCGDGVEGL
jgi:hypothetical protein